jgi:hypothetical protein
MFIDTAKLHQELVPGQLVRANGKHRIFSTICHQSPPLILSDFPAHSRHIQA